MEVIDYEILVKDLIPPIGGMIKYYAVVRFLVVKTDSGNKRVNPNLHESHGKTKDEARRKMQEKLDEWLKNSSTKYPVT